MGFEEESSMSYGSGGSVAERGLAAGRILETLLSQSGQEVKRRISSSLREDF